VPCGGCDEGYGGETKQHVSKRLTHHQDNVKNKENETFLSTEHNSDFKNVKILCRGLRCDGKRKLRECKEIITRKKTVINFRSDADSISDVYSPVITHGNMKKLAYS